MVPAFEPLWPSFVHEAVPLKVLGVVQSLGFGGDRIFASRGAGPFNVLFGGGKAFWVSTFAAFKWNPGIQDNVLCFRNMEPEKDHHLWSCFFLFGGGSFFPKDHHLWRIFLFGGGSFFPKDHQLWRIFLFGGWKAFWVSTFAAFKWNPGIQDNVLYFRNMEPERPSSLELLLFVWGGEAFSQRTIISGESFCLGGEAFSQRTISSGESFCLGGGKLFGFPHSLPLSGIQESRIMCYTSAIWNPKDHHLWSCFFLFGGGGSFFPKDHHLWRIFLFGGEAFSQRTISSRESFCLGGGKLFGFPHSLPLSGIQESRIMCYTSATWNPKDHHLWSCFFCFGGGKLFPKGPSSLENLFVWGGKLFPKGPSALENLFVWGVESFLGFHIRCL